MRKLVCCLIFAGAMVPAVGHAQIKIDMARVTCGQYVAMPSDQASVFEAWMSGWFNQKKGYTYINLQAYARNVANVRQYCAGHPEETVMATLERATAN
jgi:acid stress chaperone HdeB